MTTRWAIEPRRHSFRDVRPQALEDAALLVGVVEHDPRGSLRQSGARSRWGSVGISPGNTDMYCRSARRRDASSTALLSAGYSGGAGHPCSVSAGAGRHPARSAITRYCRARESVCARDADGPTPPVWPDERVVLVLVDALHQFHRSEDRAVRRLHTLNPSGRILQQGGESVPVGIRLFGRVDRDTLVHMGPLAAILNVFATFHDGPRPRLPNG